MKTKPYIIDDMILRIMPHVPEKVVETIREMHREIYDNRSVKKELKNQITENGKLQLRIEDLQRKVEYLESKLEQPFDIMGELNG